MSARKRPSLTSARRADAGRRGTDQAKATVAKLAEQEASGGGERSKATFDLPPDLLAELRVASVMLPPEAVGRSISALVEQAVRRELERLRAEFNRGEKFPTPATARARRGRPTGT